MSLTVLVREVSRYFIDAIFYNVKTLLYRLLQHISDAVFDITIAVELTLVQDSGDIPVTLDLIDQLLLVHHAQLNDSLLGAAFSTIV